MLVSICISVSLCVCVFVIDCYSLIVLNDRILEHQCLLWLTIYTYYYLTESQPHRQVGLRYSLHTTKQRGISSQIRLKHDVTLSIVRP